MKTCKECSKKAYAKGYCEKHYRKCDVNAFLTKVYKNMRQRVLGIQKTNMNTYYGLELLSKEEFINFTKNNDQFARLYKEWIQNGYKRTETPSVDRIDSTKGYTLDNIRWLPNWLNFSYGATSDKRL